MDLLRMLLDYLFDYLGATPWWVVFLQLLLLLVVYYAFKGIYLLGVLHFSGRYQMPLSFHRDGIKKILLLGDSTAVGTGVRDTSQTLAAFFAKDFPDVSIINKAVNGSITRQVLEQMYEVHNDQFDLVVISTGGNDVWSLTSKGRLRQDIKNVLDVAKTISGGKVVLLFFGNEGSAPFFPLFLKGYLLKRTEMVRKVFAETATKEKVIFFELFSQVRENPFVKDPVQNFAPDGLHPNESGYWNWYKHFWRLMTSSGGLRF